MKIIADLHIHSKFSRATSKNMDLEGISKWAKIKGIDLIGTGDFTHPIWFKEISEKLKESDEIEGTYSFNQINFIPTVEISSIYKKNGKVRRIHQVIIAPDIEKANEFNKQLEKRNVNLKSDGRPITGLSAKQIAEIAFDNDCLVFPAHIWTPWFALFGSKSGFDSVEECYEELSDDLLAMETGLSSDPLMNYRVSALDKYALISNSDAHSPQKLGREANYFEINNPNFEQIVKAIKQKDKTIFKATYEFYPQEGKYYCDGDRNHHICTEPEESKKYSYRCPVCRRELTKGVLSRVDELADRPYGFKPKDAIPFKYIVPLKTIVAQALGKTETSKFVERKYFEIVEKIPEFDLLTIKEKELKELGIDEKIKQGIINCQKGNIKIEPGYDGVFGKVLVFDKPKQKQKIKTLDDYLN